MSLAAIPNGRNGTALAHLDSETEIESRPLSIAIRSEIEAQVSTAKRYPRSIVRFKEDAFAMATLTPAIATSCGYTLPRKKQDGSPVTGPSVRLAEIIAASYGNLRVVARITGEDRRFITAEATCLDTERNYGVTMEVRRRITKASGETYGDDMIGVTGAAAITIARRNAIFAVVPNAFTQVVYQEAMRVARGDSDSILHRCESWIAYFEGLKIPRPHIFAAIGVNGIDDMTDRHLDALVGFRSVIDDGTMAIEEAFPVPESGGKTYVDNFVANGSIKPETTAPTQAADVHVIGQRTQGYDSRAYLQVAKDAASEANSELQSFATANGLTLATPSLFGHKMVHNALAIKLMADGLWPTQTKPADSGAALGLITDPIYGKHRDQVRLAINAFFADQLGKAKTALQPEPPKAPEAPAEVKDAADDEAGWLKDGEVRQ